MKSLSNNTLFSQNVNYAYKKSGALESIGTSMISGDALSTTNVIDSLSYRAFGSAKQVVYGNDRQLNLTYTAGLNRLTNMTATRWDGSEKMIDHTYTYADNGLISRTDDAMDTVYTRGYDYNYRNQLKIVYGYNYSQSGYSFDNFGNKLNGMTFPKIGTSDTPVNNRPNSFNNGTATINFSYDNAGNLTAAGATTYQWDGANRLKSVNGGTSGSYGFDGNGKRVRKTEGGASTYYVYSSVIGSAVMEVASAGVQRAYVNGGQGNIIAQRNPDGNFYWLHTDHLGSGRKMTNTSGNLTYRAEFDPYGKLLYEWSATPNQNTKKFTGYERDAGSGLDYAQARMYASEWGRFMSPDPKGLAAANKQSPKSFNRYSYTSGDPVNKIDPAGTDESYWLAQTNSYWSLFTFGIWYGTSSLLGLGTGTSFGSSGETFDIDYSSIIAGIADMLAEKYSYKPKPFLQIAVDEPGQTHGSGCGEAFSRVHFSLSNLGAEKDNVNGWVIQYVTEKGAKVDSQGRAIQLNNHVKPLWEAWQVRGGEIYKGNSDSPHNADTFSLISEGPSIGNFSRIGRVKFFQLGEISFDPNTWGAQASTAKGLLSTFNDPGWKGIDAGASDHSLTVEWNCLDGKTGNLSVNTNPR